MMTTSIGAVLFAFLGTAPDPPSPVEAWSDFMAEQGDPIRAAACAPPTTSGDIVVVCYGTTSDPTGVAAGIGTLVAGEWSFEVRAFTSAEVPELESTTTVPAQRRSILWPFDDSGQCTPGQSGDLEVTDYDDSTVTEFVPVVCVEGSWHLAVEQPLDEATRLAILECVDELVTLDAGPSCNDVENRLALESDPAAFAVRRQLQVIAFNVSFERVEGSMSPETFTDLELLIDMLNAYAQVE